jgi:hypothetical protein
MAKTVATILGIVFVIIGIVGFFAKDLLGAHLSPVHNVIHLVSGLVSLWLGSRGTMSAARAFCLVFGLVYAGLGAVGFLAGDAANDRLLTVIPGQLDLGARDHLIHVVLGAIYLIGGLATRPGAVMPRTATTFSR